MCKNAFLIIEHSIIVFAMMTSTAVVPYPKTQNHSSLNFPIWSNCRGVGNSKSVLSWLDTKGRKWCELYPSSILSNTSEFISPELNKDMPIVNNLNTFRVILIWQNELANLFQSQLLSENYFTYSNTFYFTLKQIIRFHVDHISLFDR